MKFYVMKTEMQMHSRYKSNPLSRLAIEKVYKLPVPLRF
jgi:hypothetical protein